MVYIQTTHDISCTIEGDKIVQDGDNVIVYLVNNGKSGKPSFDYEAFYAWCERQTNPIFISEYSMPEDRFECIMEIETTSTLCATNNNKKTVEKLFIPRCQEDVSIKQLSLF